MYPVTNIVFFKESFLFQNLMEFPLRMNTCKVFVFVTITSTSRRLPGRQNLCMPHNLGTIIRFRHPLGHCCVLLSLKMEWGGGDCRWRKLTLNSRAIQLDVGALKNWHSERANKSPKQNQITIIHLGGFIAIELPAAGWRLARISASYSTAGKHSVWLIYRMSRKRKNMWANIKRKASKTISGKCKRKRATRKREEMGSGKEGKIGKKEATVLIKGNGRWNSCCFRILPSLEMLKLW